MDTILYIKSNFRSYNMCLYKENDEAIFFKHYAFTTYSQKSKSEELQNSSLANTKLLIECAQNNGISSFEVEMNGPLGYSPLNFELLKANNINITCIKDTTPIPHNGYRPKKERGLRKIKATNIYK